MSQVDRLHDIGDAYFYNGLGYHPSIQDLSIYDPSIQHPSIYDHSNTPINTIHVPQLITTPL